MPSAPSSSRQHDRGRHLRGAPEHRRRARARPSTEPLMDFAFTDEQRQLQREVRAWLAANYPLDRDWEAQDDRWQELAELGWLGGADLSFVEEAILFEETGYALYPGPFLVAVGFVLPWLGPEDREALAAGSTKWSAEDRGLVPWLGSVD